jgi:hypothetical protein
MSDARQIAHGIKIAACLGFSMLVVAAAAQPTGQSAGNAVEPYTPGIGEIMMFQQLRHAKLWFAAHERNWALADYEVKELREGFEAVAKFYPTLNDVPLAQMIDTIRDTNFTELDKAIAARDWAKFAATYDGLTQACNACHQASDLGFISIRRPSTPPFSNQSFSPHK